MTNRNVVKSALYILCKIAVLFLLSYAIPHYHYFARFQPSVFFSEGLVLTPLRAQLSTKDFDLLGMSVVSHSQDTISVLL